MVYPFTSLDSQPDVGNYYRVASQSCPREYFQDLQSHRDTCIYNILIHKCMISIHISIYLHIHTHTHTGMLKIWGDCLARPVWATWVSLTGRVAPLSYFLGTFAVMPSRTFLALLNTEFTSWQKCHGHLNDYCRFGPRFPFSGELFVQETYPEPLFSGRPTVRSQTCRELGLMMETDGQVAAVDSGAAEVYLGS